MRSLSTLILGITLLVLLLTLAAASNVLGDVLDLDRLETAAAAASDLVTATALGIGGWWAILKFQVTRVAAEHLDIRVKNKVVDYGGQSRIVIVSIEIENTGGGQIRSTRTLLLTKRVDVPQVLGNMERLDEIAASESRTHVIQENYIFEPKETYREEIAVSTPKTSMLHIEVGVEKAGFSLSNDANTWYSRHIVPVAGDIVNHGPAVDEMERTE